MNFCTYIWSDPKSGIPRYVGKGLPGRPYTHLEPSADTQIARLLKKRVQEGFLVEPEIIGELSEEHAHLLEIELIALWGREDLGTGCLFNRTNGGDGISGMVFSEESIRKMKSSQAAYWTPKRRKQHSILKKAHFQKPQVLKAVGKASSARFKDPEFRERHSKVRRKPCTVDITIYPSQQELIKALGWTKYGGAGDPSFRYVEKT